MARGDTRGRGGSSRGVGPSPAQPPPPAPASRPPGREPGSCREAVGGPRGQSRRGARTFHQLQRRSRGLALLAVLVGPLSSKPLAGVEVVPTGTSGGGEFIWVALSKTGFVIVRAPVARGSGGEGRDGACPRAPPRERAVRAVGRGGAGRGSASSAPPPGLANPDWLPAPGAREGAALKAGRGARSAPPAAGEERGEEASASPVGGSGRPILSHPGAPLEARQRGPGQAGRGARPGPDCQTSTSAASPLRRCPCRAPHDGRTPGGQRGMSQEPGPRGSSPQWTGSCPCPILAGKSKQVLLAPLGAAAAAERASPPPAPHPKPPGPLPAPAELGLPGRTPPYPTPPLSVVERTGPGLAS
ncbi:skin secretory protein xP2-like [Eschrichtius robustus]|uniref:skin secretory protein xP2-like n=1 Tax=Eschrichtius robustus TaxID=9764 RepID=UPI0035C0B4CF